MKLRHAAALALVGWYLIIPPVKNGRADRDAPFSKWEILSAFDQAQECNASKDTRTNLALISLKKKDLGPLERDAAVGFLAAQCVATDDPRLKR